jgi:hypothetical protein
MANTIGIGTISGRVVVQLDYGRHTSVTEFDLTEAKRVQQLLDRAIAVLESGVTTQPDLASLIHSL